MPIPMALRASLFPVGHNGRRLPMLASSRHLCQQVHMKVSHERENCAVQLAGLSSLDKMLAQKASQRFYGTNFRTNA